jgi:hypothetical protein
MAFETVQIKTTLNGLNSITGPRQDAAIADVVVASLTSTVGVTSFKWQLKGRPEFSAAGGGGNPPWPLGAGTTSTFTVDSDAGGVARDGTYVIECVLNEGSPTETHITSFVARVSGLTVSAPAASVVSLRKLGVFESLEDIISINGTIQGWATQLNRWLRAIQDIVAAGSGVTSVNGEEGDVFILGPMVHTDEGGNIRVDNAWTTALGSVPGAGDIDTDAYNGFDIAELTQDLVVPIPILLASAEDAEGRKITFTITQDAITRTVTWTGGAGGYQFAKVGSTPGPTVAQFDTLLASMLNAESLKVMFERNGLRDRWICTHLSGPYV